MSIHAGRSDGEVPLLLSGSGATFMPNNPEPECDAQQAMPGLSSGWLVPGYPADGRMSAACSSGKRRYATGRARRAVRAPQQSRRRRHGSLSAGSLLDGAEVGGAFRHPATELLGQATEPRGSARMTQRPRRLARGRRKSGRHSRSKRRDDARRLCQGHSKRAGAPIALPQREDDDALVGMGRDAHTPRW